MLRGGAAWLRAASRSGRRAPEGRASGSETGEFEQLQAQSASRSRETKAKRVDRCSRGRDRGRFHRCTVVSAATCARAGSGQAREPATSRKSLLSDVSTRISSRVRTFASSDHPVSPSFRSFATPPKPRGPSPQSKRALFRLPPPPPSRPCGPISPSAAKPACKRQAATARLAPDEQQLASPGAGYVGQLP